MKKWDSITIKGTPYDLSHLNSFCLEYQIADGSSLTVRIHCSAHCFTENFNPELHSEDLKYTWQDFNGVEEIRAFNTERYQLSLQLPMILKNIKHVHFSKHRRTYFVLKINEEVNYAVYFGIRKKKFKPYPPHIELTIYSAYNDTRASKRSSKINFINLLYNTFHGKEVKIPPK